MVGKQLNFLAIYQPSSYFTTCQLQSLQSKQTPHYNHAKAAAGLPLQREVRHWECCPEPREAEEGVWSFRHAARKGLVEVTPESRPERGREQRKHQGKSCPKGAERVRWSHTSPRGENQSMTKMYWKSEMSTWKSNAIWYLEPNSENTTFQNLWDKVNTKFIVLGW